MNEKCTLYTGDAEEILKGIGSGAIDLTVTSPPYDKLRNYGGSADGWCFEKFQAIAQQLFRVTKQGGVLVWVVGDQTTNGSESGSSFKQALTFKEIGFRLHDTMIYQKNALPMNHNRYEQEFEFMFVLSKGRPSVFNPIRVPCKFPEKPTARQNSYFSETDEKMRRARSGKKRKPVGADKIKGNVWYFTTGKNHSTKYADAFKHPAIFPEQLAHDHIATWSVEGDTVLDPFMGSGTTGAVALSMGRSFIGIDIDKKYVELAESRIKDTASQLAIAWE